MNTLSSLPPPVFGSFGATTPAAPTAPADAALRGAAPAFAGLDEVGAGPTLHVSSESTPRPLDDIERDFLSALCENPPA